MDIVSGVVFLGGLAVILYYFNLISTVFSGWDGYEETTIPKGRTPKIKFTIIVPTRNEGATIHLLCESLLRLDYPKQMMQVILVNDHSSDNTVAVLNSYPQFELHNLTDQEGKKSALTLGIAHAKYDTILCLDADVEVHKDLLKLYDVKYGKGGIQFIAGGVHIPEKETWLSRFQSLDTHTLMAATCAGIAQDEFYLANGANMSFKKEVFNYVKGFEGNEDQASGDDVYLVKKIRDVFGHNAIGYLKSRRGAVVTEPMDSVAKLLNQRKRWASKTKGYASKGLIKFQAGIAVTHLVILIYFCLTPLFPICFFVGLFMYFTKAVIDYLFLDRLTYYYHSAKSLKWYLVSHLLYFPYIMYMSVIALIPQSYTWKGRNLK